MSNSIGETAQDMVIVVRKAERPNMITATGASPIFVCPHPTYLLVCLTENVCVCGGGGVLQNVELDWPLCLQLSIYPLIPTTCEHFCRHCARSVFRYTSVTRATPLRCGEV